MAHILNIQSSPRSACSASITVANAFLLKLQKLHPDTTIDTLNVWEEHLPEFNREAIGAKQLIDLACQRNLLFTFNGKQFGPLLQTSNALVVHSQGRTTSKARRSRALTP